MMRGKRGTKTKAESSAGSIGPNIRCETNELATECHPFGLQWSAGRDVQGEFDWLWVFAYYLVT